MGRFARWVWGWLLILAGAGFVACERQSVVVPVSAGTTFSDVTLPAGIHFRHETGAFGNKWMPETMGSGCALFDWDGDGLLDVLLINGTYWPGHEKAGALPTLRLYRNVGGWQFEDVTVRAGLDFSIYGMGCAVGDFDGDGDLDLFLTAVGNNRLLRNDDGRFVEVTEMAGVAGGQWVSATGQSHAEWSTGAAWVDVDGDGWLDLFVCNYVQWAPEADLFATIDGVNKSYATPQQYPGSSNRLYRNRGDGTFDDVTLSAGIFNAHGKSLGVVVLDADGDGNPDLIVANDTEPNFYYRNRGDGTFEERGVEAGVAYGADGRARAGMGIDVAVLEGQPVVAIGNFSREPVSLFQRSTDGFFADEGEIWGVAGATFWSLTFGLVFFDFDLDGAPDLALANGHIDPGINRVQRQTTYAQQAQLFRNDGKGRFREVSNQSGPPFLRPVVGRGLAFGDLDGDGDLDLVMTTSGGSAVLMRNEGPVGQALRIRLRGAWPNIHALGAVVTVESGGQMQQAMVRTGASYLSQSEMALTFGLGQKALAEQVRVRWPGGQMEVLEDLEAGATYVVEQGKGVVARQPFGEKGSVLGMGIK